MNNTTITKENTTIGNTIQAREFEKANQHAYVDNAIKYLGVEAVCQIIKEKLEQTTILKSEPVAKQKAEPNVTVVKKGKSLSEIATKELPMTYATTYAYSEKTEKKLVELCKKYFPSIMVKERGKCKSQKGILCCNTLCYYIIDLCGEKMLQDVLDVLYDAQWYHEAKGLTAMYVETVFHVLALHYGRRKEIKPELSAILSRMNPHVLKSFAIMEYPGRTPVAAMTMWMEDLLKGKLKIQKKFK